MKRINFILVLAFFSILPSCQFNTPYLKTMTFTIDGSKLAGPDITVDYATLVITADGEEIYNQTFNNTTTATIEIEAPLDSTVDFVWSEFLDQNSYDLNQPWMVASSTYFVDENLTQVDIKPFRLDPSPSATQIDWLNLQVIGYFNSNNFTILNSPHDDYEISYEDDNSKSASFSGSADDSTTILPYYMGGGILVYYTFAGHWTITESNSNTKTIYYHYNLNVPT